jgi:hypothetical protein
MQRRVEVPGTHPIGNDTVDLDLLRFDGEIHLELELVGQRMTWLSISHSFLFSAFTVEVVARASAAPAIRHVLRHAIPMIGIVSAVSVGLAVLAAQASARSLRRERAELEARRADASPAGFAPSLTRSAWIVRLGDLPPRLIPWLLAVTWMVLLAKVLTGGA